ncbi:MAG: ATP phosphoribosyltransferase regulatory subunit [Pseudomonadota bacterium]
MTGAAIRRKAAQLQSVFEAAGATPVETSVLLPAETLLDLYGEDIRARAYVTSDALRGEQMLRPDFTVPVVLAHLATGERRGCYTYAGEVFRRQDISLQRPNEYMQVGFELFDDARPEKADALVFSTICKALSGADLRMAIGDIGILAAAVRGLDTTDRRKQALMRHIWRPARFRALIERFSGRAPTPPSRAALIAAENPVAESGTLVGLRSQAEIDLRIAALREDAATAALSVRDVDALDALLAVSRRADLAVEDLNAIADDLPAIGNAVGRLTARLDALQTAGVDVSALDFEGSYGRTLMEYYDGFVFGFYDPARPDLPPVASGGRYDALTRQLGQGRNTPAVGGVIRPDLLCARDMSTRRGRS